MRLRNRADWRALLWVFVLFPMVPALGLWRPDLALWLVPLGIYTGYCAGVLTHNHNHCPVFLGRGPNQFYAAWLSVFYGYPTFAWIPTHNQNHHRYVNGPGDATRTTRYSDRDTLWNALSYPVRSAFWQAEGIQNYIKAAKEKKPDRFREIVIQYVVLIAGQGALLSAAIFLHGAKVGAATWFLTAAIPALFASWSMMFTNYLQHVQCDPSSPDNHSRNFVSPIQNWFVFDAGFHTVHHENAGTHWSQYRRLHAERKAAIDPRLCENSIFGYCFRRYVLGAVVPSLRAPLEWPQESSTGNQHQQLAENSAGASS